jgi:signal transduction histidine kinase
MPIFAGVPKAGLARIAGHLQRRHLLKGTTIFKQGDPAREFCLLTSGRLEVTVAGGDPDSPPVGVIEAPSWFGELALVTRQPRTATIRALTDSEVWVLPREDFDAVFKRHPEMARNLISTLCERIQRKDQDFLGQSTLAIERARLLNDLRERNEELAALAEVTRAVSASLDLDETLQTISTHAAQLTGSDSASIYLYDKAQDAFEVRASYNTPEEYLREAEGHRVLNSGAPAQPPMPARSLIALTVVGRAPTQIPNVETAMEYPSRDLVLRWNYRALLAVPLLLGDRVIGVMIVRRRRAGEFTKREVELVTTFARQSAVAIQNARLFREIEDKGRQLEIASKHKSQFLASMSHELRTPLNAIIGFSEVLLDPNLGPLPAEEQQEFLTNILTSGRHLLRLINDILDLSKVEAGKMELHPEAVSLVETVEGVLGTVKPLATKKQIAVKSDLAANLPPAWADPPRLKQILYNLLSNAIKFTPASGHVTVTARHLLGESGETANRRTGEAFAPIPRFTDSPVPAHGGYLEISVQDTGIGIPAKDLERIFEEFEQVADPGRPRQEGTGLGLALVKRLVEMHGGRIRVASTPGQGSTFTFVIPAAGG